MNVEQRIDQYDPALPIEQHVQDCGCRLCGSSYAHWKHCRCGWCEKDRAAAAALGKIDFTDRALNQSESHQRMSHQALSWVANRATAFGVRGAVEIQVPGWKRADAVAVFALDAPARRTYGVSPDLCYDIFAVFEAKASLSDFYNDFPKGSTRMPPLPGYLNWIVASFDPPKDSGGYQFWPRGWGVLKACGPNGRTLREIVKPLFVLKPWETIIPLYRELLWRSRRHIVLPCPDCAKLTEARDDERK